MSEDKPFAVNFTWGHVKDLPGAKEVQSLRDTITALTKRAEEAERERDNLRGIVKEYEDHVMPYHASCVAVAEARATAAERRLAEAEKVIAPLLSQWDEYQASNGNMEEAYYKLAKYARAHWEAARKWQEEGR